MNIKHNYIELIRKDLDAVSYPTNLTFIEKIRKMITFK